MNYQVIFRTIGNLLKVAAILMIFPLIISLIYRENNYLAFLIPMATSLALGFLLTIRKKEKHPIHAREGFVIVGISWIILSIIGALPFIISGTIHNFVDAFFEAVSGFTTTGATILNDIEALDKGIIFWRSFTHWIGGMGILVFVIAILPQSGDRGIYIMKAESPGPQKGDKLVSKVKFNALILYSIYVGLTFLAVITLLILKMPLFDSVVHAMSTAGTGGFSLYNQSIGYYNSASIEVALGIFMILFGINFNIYYLILIGNFKNALKSEELRWYLSIVAVSVILITINIYAMDLFSTIGESLRHAFFNTASIVSTTGYGTVDFNLWPAFSKWLLIILMFVGASAGSTAGGMKVSRFIIYIKAVFKEIRNSLHPNQVSSINIDKKPIDNFALKGASSYLMAYFLILIIGTLLISINNFDVTTNFTAVISCLNNVGPGLGLIGPTGNYSIFSSFSKIVLSFIMLSGRLEIFPIMILFSHKTWRKF